MRQKRIAKQKTALKEAPQCLHTYLKKSMRI